MYEVWRWKLTSFDAPHYSRNPIPTSVDIPFIRTTRAPKVEYNRDKRGEVSGPPCRSLRSSCSKRLSNSLDRTGAICTFQLYPGRDSSDILGCITPFFCELHEPLQNIDSERLEPDPAQQLVRLRAARASEPRRPHHVNKRTDLANNVRETRKCFEI
jgi:hypothetical protein